MRQAEALIEHVLAGYDRRIADIRDAAQLCVEAACVSAGSVDGRAMLALRPAAD